MAQGRATTEVPFGRRLVLFHWGLSLFGAKNFDDLAQGLREERLEGWTPDNKAKLLEPLIEKAEKVGLLSEDQLTGYDANIYSHTLAISGKRAGGGVLVWKYFQYLSLLFTEIYLDKYFSDRPGLVAELNLFLKEFNQGLPPSQNLEPYTEADLGKLAFWNATGSGKTLLMHVQLLQYEKYRKDCQHDEPNQLILLTPSEGLSRQHLEEFAASSIEAGAFDKQASLGWESTRKMVQVIEISKLALESGDKTVAYEAFGSNNLLMVDEGHRGADGEAWMKYRRELCSNGFSFEYSATFGQAVGRGALSGEYAKCILFDYSYCFFYGDGFGKEFRILNLDDKGQAEELHRFYYLTAALLSFYQQLRYFEEQGTQIKPFLIERPLWIFVGGSVNALRTENGKTKSDVIEVLLFLARFLAEPKLAIEAIDLVLEGKAGIVIGERDPLTRSLSYLRGRAQSTEALHQDLLERFFNGSGGRLHIELAHKKEGEILLKSGENEEPFGVINVGDADKLYATMAGTNKKAKPDAIKLAEQCGRLMHCVERSRQDTYFSKISSNESRVNLLIGSKKFTEGWSSWRVSTIGLMKIGQSEGPQIIQLFGRGVRLKGYKHRLKRSSALEFVEVPRPEDLPIVETLNLFGIQASYMDQFRQYLEAEECNPVDEPEIVEVPVRLKLPAQPPLWQPKLPEKLRFKHFKEKPELEIPDEYFSRYQITIDWYPKIQGALSVQSDDDASTINKTGRRFTPAQLALLDWDKVYFEVERFKAERSWHNLSLSRTRLIELFTETPQEILWYEVLIPAEQMELRHFGTDVARWQEIVTAVIKKYVEKFYHKKKAEWEQERMELLALDEKDNNLPELHRFAIDREQKEPIEGLKRLAEEYSVLEEGRPYHRGYQFPEDLDVFLNDRHLYDPLVYLSKEGKKWISVSPLELNAGERDFCNDVQTFVKASPDILEGRQLHLLRNQSKGRGLGFFEEGGFYPDFILWLIDGEKQHVAFIDPKGLQRMHGGDYTRKIEFYKRIKELGKQIGAADKGVELHSFIVSSTKFAALKTGKDGPQDIPAFNDRNVFFRTEQDGEYVNEMLRRVFGEAQL